MEADWAVEVGGEAPRLEADWAGFVDLHREVARVDRVAEAQAHPALRAALVTLNEARSPVFTSKCDVWELPQAAIDPVEFDCTADDGRVGLASYVDVIGREAGFFAAFAKHEGWVRRATAALRAEPGPCGRVDLVVRSAVAGGAEGFGVTLYAAGCGVNASHAEGAWAAILNRAAAITMRAVAE